MRAPIALALLAWLALAACSKASHRPPPPATETPAGEATVTLPGASPTPASRTTESALAGAAQALREGRFEAAAAAYDGAAASTADPELRAQALLGAGIARYESGDSAGAIANLQRAAASAPPGSRSQRRAGYLLGLRLDEAGRYGEAEAALRSFAAAGATDALQPYLIAEHAKAAGRAGDHAAAAAGWETLLALPAPPAQLVELAYREQAAAAKAAGDTANLPGLVTKLAAITSDPTVRYELAELARAAGDMATFTTQLRAIISSNPGSREAVLAIASLREAGYVVDKGQAGLVYYRRGAYAEARTELLKAIAEPDLAPLDLAFRLYYLGASYEDAGQPATAVGYYDRAAAAAPASPYAYRAKYWAARSAEAIGDYAAASARYAAVAAALPAGDFSPESAFRAGYVLLRAGDAGAAIAAWDAAPELASARLLYWKGQALQRRGDDTAARATWERATSLDPWGFYGEEAARELGRTAALDISFRKAAADLAPDWDAITGWLRNLGLPGSPGTPPADAAELMALGLRSEAAASLEGAASGTGAWQLLALVQQAHSLGLQDVSARLASRLKEAAGSADGGTPDALLRLMYPLGYVELLNQEASSAGLDPLFLAALVRQESFWDPLAGSRAGALGLTQVIPTTGEGIARALNVQGFKAEDLFRPAVSLRFGAYYLGGQFGRFGTPQAALSAYNAGPGNAVRWADAAGAGPAPAFVEAIDISETHDYVERVLDHYARYRHLYGGSQ